jgi:hypothetical protein
VFLNLQRVICNFFLHRFADILDSADDFLYANFTT